MTFGYWLFYFRKNGNKGMLQIFSMESGSEWMFNNTG